MITNELLDTLTDDEILVFNSVLRREKYNAIAANLKLRSVEVSYIMSGVYAKLNIWPRMPVTLRMVWRHSLLENQRVRKLAGLTHG